MLTANLSTSSDHSIHILFIFIHVNLNVASRSHVREQQQRKYIIVYYVLHITLVASCLKSFIDVDSNPIGAVRASREGSEFIHTVLQCVFQASFMSLLAANNAVPGPAAGHSLLCVNPLHQPLQGQRCAAV